MARTKDKARRIAANVATIVRAAKATPAYGLFTSRPCLSDSNKSGVAVEVVLKLTVVVGEPADGGLFTMLPVC
jgi:hypothetical protein